MKLPYWLLCLLPMWDYICPKCRKEVKKDSHKCVHCDEVYGNPVRVPPRILEDPKALESYVHKHVFPRVSKAQRDYLAQYFTELFSDGQTGSTMETEEDFSAWSGKNEDANTTITVSTDVSHHGSNSAELATSQRVTEATTYIYKAFSAEATAFARCYFYAHSLPSEQANDKVEIIAFYGTAGVASGTAAAYLFNSSGTIVWLLMYRDAAAWNTDTTTSPAISAGKWYCVELKNVVGDPNGESRMYIDDIEILTQTGLDNDDRGDNQGIRCLAYPTLDTDKKFNIDCVVVADTYIGPETAPYLKVIHKIN